MTEQPPPQPPSPPPAVRRNGSAEDLSSLVFAEPKYTLKEK